MYGFVCSFLVFPIIIVYASGQGKMILTYVCPKYTVFVIKDNIPCYGVIFCVIKPFVDMELKKSQIGFPEN